ncbi:MAG: tRNA uridine-5-carboxymethylaminomethyl(34) synthesis enzyme MnmG [Opitutales bacterium]
MKNPLRVEPDRPYEVIICGAGHAGCEAALAASRLGADTLLLTGNIDTCAQMSCNPAIGGQAKGQIVREIDALGGEMAVTADTTGIQFRLLNRPKGPAVQAPRVQCDKKTYQFRIKHRLESQKKLTLFQCLVTGLIFEGDAVVGVRTSIGANFYGRTIIVTTGTFLRGLMHIGENKNDGGRLGDFTSSGLSGSLMEAGIGLQRLKTGTPPRILGSSVDFGKCEVQPGDEKVTSFGFYDSRGKVDLFHVEQSGQRLPGWHPGSDQVPCWITSTTGETERLIRSNLHRSPLYSGIIESSGPRYCPSIEDKFVRFTEKSTHRLFLEPEGRNTDEWYINGLSTSLPFDVQLDVLRSVTGLERVQMLRPAYAVEYDFAPPTQLQPSLESKKVENLFFAGQINGTSGYEEAAGQGLVAGVNAVAKVRGESPLVLGRDQAYIGVLIDDLVTKGTQEPYRMFTSRAEYRLSLNHGSAEYRLCDAALERGLVSQARGQRMREFKQSIDGWVERIESTTVSGGRLGDLLRGGNSDSEALWPQQLRSESETVRAEVNYRILYQGYLQREERQMKKMLQLERVRIPEGFEFAKVPGLRNEAREKLQALSPRTLAQAGRISGVNPADVSLLMVALKRARASVPKSVSAAE